MLVSRHAQLVSRQFQSVPGSGEATSTTSKLVSAFLAIFLNILMSMTKTEALRIGSHIF